MSSVQVKGLADLQRALDTLAPKLAANVMRGALRAGLKPIMTAASGGVPVDEGALRDSIRISAKVKQLQAVGAVKAGGRRKGKRPAYHAHLVEYGTGPHRIEARPPNKALAIGVFAVEHPGSRAQPFMRPALDGQHGAAVTAMADYIRKRLKDKHGIDVPVPLEDEDE